MKRQKGGDMLTLFVVFVVSLFVTNGCWGSGVPIRERLRWLPLFLLVFTFMAVAAHFKVDGRLAAFMVQSLHIPLLVVVFALIALVYFCFFRAPRWAE
jgi:hypothetical protein